MKTESILQELTTFYRNYLLVKTRLNHHKEQEAILLNRLFVGMPTGSKGIKIDDLPKGTPVRPDLQRTTEELLQCRAEIHTDEATIKLFDETFKDFDAIFSQYSVRKYTILIMRLNGKTNKEIASELGLSHDRVRHIITELNQDLQLSPMITI